MPSVKVTQLPFLAGGIRSQTRPSSTTFDLVGSINGAEKPMPSHHIAALPCMNVVWHSFQLKPITPGGAHSRMIFTVPLSAASIAASVSLTSFLPPSA